MTHVFASAHMVHDPWGKGCWTVCKLELNFAELNILPPFLHKTLASISSPHFLEFSLQLCQGFSPTRCTCGQKMLWGTGWDVVDEDLYEYAVQRDNFWFPVQIVAGESTEAAVEGLFPWMKSKGSLSITKLRSGQWWQPFGFVSFSLSTCTSYNLQQSSNTDYYETWPAICASIHLPRLSKS